MSESKNDPAVSVIIPVYRPGKALARCLASVLRQTLGDLEVIVVDDCGGDHSMDLVRNAAKRDSRVRILTNEKNLGAGPSRNRGIEAARGKYLSFVDADDCIHKCFLELLVRRAEEAGADIAKGVCVYMGAWEDGKKHTTAPVVRSPEYIRDMADRMPLYSLFVTEHWSAVYRRGFLTDPAIRYGTTRCSEDTTFLLGACLSAETFVLEKRARYYHFRSRDSLSQVLTVQRLKDQLAALETQLQLLTGKAEENEYFYNYVNERVRFLLGAHAEAAAAAGNRRGEMRTAREDVEAFLGALRRMVRAQPFAEQLCLQSAETAALSDYGENLACLWNWKENPFADELYTGAVRSSVRFALRHPECSHIYEPALKKALRCALEYADFLPEEEAERKKTFRKKLRRLLAEPFEREKTGEMKRGRAGAHTLRLRLSRCCLEAAAAAALKASPAPECARKLKSLLPAGKRPSAMRRAAAPSERGQGG